MENLQQRISISKERINSYAAENNMDRIVLENQASIMKSLQRIENKLRKM